MSTLQFLALYFLLFPMCIEAATRPGTPSAAGIWAYFITVSLGFAVYAAVLGAREAMQ